MFFYGVVENRMDPLYLGRCQVRVVGVHTDNMGDLPTADLPWAYPMGPIQSASVSGIGSAPVGPVEGTWVIVFFKDGEDMQQPIMIGTLTGTSDAASLGGAFSDPSKKYPLGLFLNEPDTNRLARGERIDDTLVKSKELSQIRGAKLGNGTGTWSQPDIPFTGKYPFNHVVQSESGNIFEMDDTEKAERIHEFHRSGTFTEIDANGTQVNRIVGNNYEIIDNDGFVYIKGQCVINVVGSATINVQESAHIEVGEKVNVVAKGDINLGSEQNITLQANDKVQVLCKDFIVNGDTASMNINGRVDILASANINLDGALINNQCKMAAPKESNPDTWSTFDASTLANLPPPPSRSQELAVAIEGITSVAEMLSLGISASDPRVSAPLDSNGARVHATSVEAVSPGTVAEQTVTAVTDPACNITNDMALTPSTKVGDMMFPASGGKVKGQHNLTACQIATNMKRVAKNIIDPIRAKFGSAMVLTSGFRVAGNQYSLPYPRTSKHELGLAVDMQFKDCKTYEDYVARVKEIRLVASFDKLLLENMGGKIWIHIQFN